MALIKKLLVAGVYALACTGAMAQDITGAGATFPAPIYAKWAEAYKAATGAQLNYQAIGSGGGVKQITAKTVDFGASDDPMSGDDLTKNGLAQFPAVIGGVVVAFNLPGVDANKITLDGAVTADIFRGAIKSWDDAAIAKLNPGLKLPATAITVVYRSDSSGTTAVFTDYLAGVSAPFKASPGEGKTVNWPVGVGGRGNAGVAANVSKIAGAIGYVEFAYAKQNKDKTTLANAGIGAASHLCGLLFQQAIETDLTTVPYKGTAPAITDLIGGQVDILCDQTTNTTEQIKAGKVKALALTAPKRLESLKDLPTSAEAGLPGFELSIWHGMYAPKNTPKPVLDKLVAALQVALKDPALNKRFADLGATTVTADRQTPDALGKHLKAEIDKWAPIIKKAGVYAD